MNIVIISWFLVSHTYVVWRGFYGRLQVIFYYGFHHHHPQIFYYEQFWTPLSQTHRSFTWNIQLEYHGAPACSPNGLSHWILYFEHTLFCDAGSGARINAPYSMTWIRHYVHDIWKSSIVCFIPVILKMVQGEVKRKMEMKPTKMNMGSIQNYMHTRLPQSPI